MDKRNYCIVLDIYKNDILLECYNKAIKKKLKSIGARVELLNWNRLHIHYSTELVLIETLYKLTALGAVFTGGYSRDGWMPAEVVEQLQKEKKFKIAFKEIVNWLNKEYLIYMVNENGNRMLVEKIIY